MSGSEIRAGIFFKQSVQSDKCIVKQRANAYKTFRKFYSRPYRTQQVTLPEAIPVTKI